MCITTSEQHLCYIFGANPAKCHALSDHQTRDNVNEKTMSPSVKTHSFTRSSHNVFVCCQNIRVSLNYSQIRARDSSAYPAVSTQSHLLMRKSLRLDVCSDVYVTTVHDRALLSGLLFGKECSPAMAPPASWSACTRCVTSQNISQTHCLFWHISPVR